MTRRSPASNASTPRALKYGDVYDEQLRRWRNERLTDAQQRETVRLQNATRELCLVLTQILALADELATGTIERQLSKSDAELGLEHLLRSHSPRETRTGKEFRPSPACATDACCSSTTRQPEPRSAKKAYVPERNFVGAVERSAGTGGERRALRSQARRGA